MEEYIPILQDLRQEGVTFVAIGSWVLKAIAYTGFESYILRDCDLVLDPSDKNVELAVGVLQRHGWKCTVWGEPLDDSISFSELEGKYYVRAIKGHLCLDLTYECAIPWPTMLAEHSDWKGIPVASIQHIMHLRELKAKDLQQQGDQ